MAESDEVVSRIRRAEERSEEMLKKANEQSAKLRADAEARAHSQAQSESARLAAEYKTAMDDRRTLLAKKRAAELDAETRRQADFSKKVESRVPAVMPNLLEHVIRTIHAQTIKDE